jgi:hypothetical protein
LTSRPATLLAADRPAAGHVDGVRGEASLSFEGVSVRYRPKLPLALADYSFVTRRAKVQDCAAHEFFWGGTLLKFKTNFKKIRGVSCAVHF